jgi:hypothetical protein
MNKYYYSDATGKSVGPLLYEELVRLLEGGQISLETYIVEEGTEAWKPFSSILSPKTSRANAPILNEPNPVNAEGLTRRYSSAYLVARATITGGQVIKLIAVIVGLIISLGGGSVAFLNIPLGKYQDMPFSNMGTLIGVLFGVAIVAFILSLPFYILGILVQAQGQVLIAILDGTVHTSPFLTDEQKASVMNIEEYLTDSYDR